MKQYLQYGQRPIIAIGKINDQFRCEMEFYLLTEMIFLFKFFRCGNVAAILELNEYLHRDFVIFEAAPQESRGIPSKKPQADYFL